MSELDAGPPRVVDGPDALDAAVGSVLGVSDWVVVDQGLIDRFAAVTGDDYWAHVDPERAKSTAIGGTIAHGLLTLSLHPALLYRMVEFRGFSHMLNYGYEKVRFPAALPSSGKVQMTATLLRTQHVAAGIRGTLELEFKSDKSVKPVCVAEYVQFFSFSTE